MLYISTKFQENISKGFSSSEDAFCILKFSKGHNSTSVGRVTVLDLFTSSDSVSYLYQVLSKFLIGFQSYKPEH